MNDSSDHAIVFAPGSRTQPGPPTPALGGRWLARWPRVRLAALIFLAWTAVGLFEAMPETFDALLAKGFKFVTVSELIAMNRPATPAPKASEKKSAAEETKTAAPDAQTVR